MPTELAYGYVKITDFLKRYDARRVADLVSDTSQRPGGNITNQVQLDALIVLLKADVNLQEILFDASEEVNLAVFIGKRYTRDQLLALALYDSPYNSKTKPEPGGYAVIRLVCDLAFGLLNSRRGLTASDTELFSPREAVAQKMLSMLRAGERIFDVVDHSNADAGLARHVDVGSDNPYNKTYVNKTRSYFGFNY
jgi:hypothetical protein